ncbi:MAG: response regulator transcription factor [Gammaproteobacteria bacterium]|nr:MAG: response regulator transcription factor [Gammaproteobacteria bacterium]
MIRVLLADDHNLVRESLVAVLRSSGECQVVAEAADGMEAVEQALKLKPDIVIVDISMPRLNGLEVLRRLTAELPQTRLLVLTMHEEDEYVLHAVRAGARGYLLKHAATADLIAAVKALAAGSTYFGPQAAQALAAQVHHPERSLDDPYGALSTREREVFHMIMEGLTSKEIARKLEISAKTAENHRARILDKLGVRNTVELMRYASRKHLLD